MKKAIAILLVLIIGSVIETLAIPAKEAPPFSQGEQMTYAIKKMGLRVGKAILEFQGTTRLDQQEVYLLIFTVRAAHFYDQEKIYLHKETFLPIQVSRDLDIWGKKEKIIEDYQPQEGLLKITKKVNGKTINQKIEKPQVLDNIYCFIYRYRILGNFQIGDTQSVFLPTRDVQMELVEKTKINLDGQWHDTFFFKSHPKGYGVWLGSGPEKIPLRIDGAAGFGKTSMILEEYKKGNEPRPL